MSYRHEDDDEDWLNIGASYPEEPQVKCDVTSVIRYHRKDELTSKHKKRKKRKKDVKGERAKRMQDQLNLSATCTQKDRAQKVFSLIQNRDPSELVCEYVIEKKGDKDNIFYGTQSEKDTPIYHFAQCVHQQQLSIRYFDQDIEELDGMAEEEELAFIHSPSTSNQFPDSSLLEDSVAEESAIKEDANDCMVRRTKLYNERLRENPQDVDTWIQFIQFQLTVVSKYCSYTWSLLGDWEDNTTILDKQLNITEKAISHNPTSDKLIDIKQKLTFRMLDLRHRNDKTTDDIKSIIEKLLIEQPNSRLLWTRFVQCHQQHFGKFSVSLMREVYCRALESLRLQLRKLSHHELQSSTVRQEEGFACASKFDELINALVFFHSALCTFERKAGYNERAIAYAQTLMQYNMYIQGCNEDKNNNDKAIAYTNDLSQWKSFSEQIQQSLMHENVRSDICTAPLMSSKPPASVKIPIRLQLASPFESELAIFIAEEWADAYQALHPTHYVFTKEHQQLLTERYSALKDAKTASVANRKSMQPKGHESSHGLVYSNLHGYRIELGDVKDREEYEKVLQELRVKNTSAHDHSMKKKQHTASINASLIANVWDERADHAASFQQLAGDQYIKWLEREIAENQRQWMPLGVSDASHEKFIQDQPERAVMVAETRPFMFRIHTSYHFHTLLTLLEQCGARVLPIISSFALYSDTTFDHGAIAQSLFSFFNVSNYQKISYSLALNTHDRIAILQPILLSKLKIMRALLYDTDKQNYVRYILDTAIRYTNRISADLALQLMTIRLDFETHVGLALQRNGSLKGHELQCKLEKQRESCLRLVLQFSVVEARVTYDMQPTLDFEAVSMTSMASYDMQMGNSDQFDEICHDVIAKCRNRANLSASHPRNFHALIFLQSREELWNTLRTKIQSSKLCKLKTLYVLVYSVLDMPGYLQPLNKLTADKGEDLEQHLGLLLDDCIVRKTIDRYEVDLETANRQCVAYNDAAKHLNIWHHFCSVGYCLHNICLALYAYYGFNAANNRFASFMASISSESSVTHCYHHEWSAACHLDFIQRHRASLEPPFVSPQVWRRSLMLIATNYQDEAYYRLLADAENGRTIVVSHELRQFTKSLQMQARKSFEPLTISYWLFLILCEILRLEKKSQLVTTSSGTKQNSFCCLWHRWQCDSSGINRLRHIFESMLRSDQHQHNGLAWRLYLRFEIAMGKVEAARKIFHRGIASCPWSKELYLDGIAVLRPYMSTKDCEDLLEWMEAKELCIRVEMD